MSTVRAYAIPVGMALSPVDRSATATLSRSRSIHVPMAMVVSTRNRWSGNRVCSWGRAYSAANSAALYAGRSRLRIALPAAGRHLGQSLAAGALDQAPDGPTAHPRRQGRVQHPVRDHALVHLEPVARAGHLPPHAYRDLDTDHVGVHAAVVLRC